VSICNLLCQKFATSCSAYFLNHNTGAIRPSFCAARREIILNVTDDRPGYAKCVTIGGIACAQCLKCICPVTAQALLGPTCIKIYQKS